MRPADPLRITVADIVDDVAASSSRIHASTPSTNDPRGGRSYLGACHGAAPSPPCSSSTPNLEAITLIGIPSLGCNQRVAQSSTLFTVHTISERGQLPDDSRRHFLPAVDTVRILIAGPRSRRWPQPRRPRQRGHLARDAWTFGYGQQAESGSILFAMESSLVVFEPDLCGCCRKVFGPFQSLESAAEFAAERKALRTLSNCGPNRGWEIYYITSPASWPEESTREAPTVR